jgi:hypothetical protein
MYKKLKNPDKPRRMRPAYEYYRMYNRGRIRVKYEDAKAHEVIEILSLEWNALDELERKSYEGMKNEDKKHHKKEMEAYDKYI